MCTLDEKSLKRAKEELKEDPKNRLGAVEAFRKWILEQPHIKCPTGLFCLPVFLRAPLPVSLFLDIELYNIIDVRL